jgi:hypothetical protein
MVYEYFGGTEWPHVVPQTTHKMVLSNQWHDKESKISEKRVQYFPERLFAKGQHRRPRPRVIS